MTGTLCPKCGGRTHRSQTRGFNEKLVKAFTPQRVYRCRECDWRGWLRNRDLSTRGHPLRTIIGVLVTLLITALLALYVIEKLSLPASNSGGQQGQPP